MFREVYEVFVALPWHFHLNQKPRFSDSSGMLFIVLHKLRYARVSTIPSFIAINRNHIGNHPCATSHILSGCASINDNCQLAKTVVTPFPFIVECIPASTATFESVSLKLPTVRLGAFFLYVRLAHITHLMCP